MSTTVRVVFNHFGKVADALEAKAALVVAKTAHDLEANAKAQAPVDTGNLRNSIQSRPMGPLAWEVAVGAEYGLYVEMGTRHAPAQPYFLPAVERVSGPFQAALGQLLGGR